MAIGLRSKAGYRVHPVGLGKKPWLRRWPSVLETGTENTIRRNSCSRSSQGLQSHLTAQLKRVG